MLQFHIFLRTTRIRTEIFTLKSPAMSVSTILFSRYGYPFRADFVRLPGYPLFIAGVYALFGHGNNQALFLLEGVLDTLPACCHACLAVVVNARALPSSD